MPKKTDEEGSNGSAVMLKYTGLSHVKSFLKSDFTRHGIDDQGAVKFDESNNWVAEVSPAAAAFLDAHDPGDFREATSEDLETVDTTRSPIGSSSFSAIASPASSGFPTSVGASGTAEGATAPASAGITRGATP